MNCAESGVHPDDPDFDLRLDRRGDVDLLSLTGRLDAVACLILKQYVVNALVRRVPPLFVVDLGGLAAIDQCAGEILVSATRHARVAGGRLIVVGGGMLPGHVADDIEVSASVGAALIELGGPRS
ncbi:STAS domain-containing protein [Nonomuraea sp. NPDC049709]|uniref:STAS domain-containing protein n=1 Tax=Nonomuraea sp. NPDC049709 TaxID=3154736 RepID=UPI0034452E64